MPDTPRIVGQKHRSAFELPEDSCGLSTDGRATHCIHTEAFVLYVNDLVNDSLEFIDEELSRHGLAPAAVQSIKARLTYGLLSEWTRFAFELDDTISLSGLGCWFRDEELIAHYFKQTFGREYPDRMRPHAASAA